MKIIQGDVVLKRVAALPSNVRALEGKILQQSETTGHHHYFLQDAKATIYETEVATEKTITPDTGKYIFLSEDTVLYHGIPSKKGAPLPNSGDHQPLNVPAGAYRVVITREYDYDKNEITVVTD
jgi:hypothetical protein